MERTVSNLHYDWENFNSFKNPKTNLFLKITFSVFLFFGGTSAFADTQLKPDEIRGIYGNNKEENYLEIISTHKNNFYFYTNLFFAEGHQCEVYGIAEYQQNDRFSYKTRFQGTFELPKEKTCDLIISFQNNKISFSDPTYNCAHLYCGARGYLDGISFKRSERKKMSLHHLQETLNSSLYQSAFEEYQINNTPSKH